MSIYHLVKPEAVSNVLMQFIIFAKCTQNICCQIAFLFGQHVIWGQAKFELIFSYIWVDHSLHILPFVPMFNETVRHLRRRDYHQFSEKCQVATNDSHFILYYDANVWNLKCSISSFERFFLVFKNRPTRPLLLIYFHSFNTTLFRISCWLQRDSNTDRQSIRQARWPLDHHNGPKMRDYFLLYNSIHKKWWRHNVIGSRHGHPFAHRRHNKTVVHSNGVENGHHQTSLMSKMYPSIGIKY